MGWGTRSHIHPSPHLRLARKILIKPIEIIVGGRSTVSGDVEQVVEVREERDKWKRLLQLLGLYTSEGSILIFADTQARVDTLFQELMRAGYFVLALHGGMDQTDRDQTIADFKNKLRTIMVATSVAGRGLDVKELVLVINYSCPNHLEDYVHRVGRTGRAGNKVGGDGGGQGANALDQVTHPPTHPPPPGHRLHVHHPR